MKGQRGTLGICLVHETVILRRPHAVLSRYQVLSEKSKWRPTWNFKHHTEVGLHADVSEDRLPLKQSVPSSKNNFRGHDISRSTPWASLYMSPHFLLIFAMLKAMTNIGSDNKIEGEGRENGNEAECKRLHTSIWKSYLFPVSPPWIHVICPCTQNPFYGRHLNSLYALVRAIQFPI